WMMRLQEELDLQLWHEIEIFEENEKMQYVSSFERFALAKIRQESKQEGKQEGVVEGEQKTLRRLLMRRFKTVPHWAEERILQGSDKELEKWLDNVLDATTLESVFTEQSSAH